MKTLPIYEIKRTNMEVENLQKKHRTLKGNEYIIYQFLVSRANNYGNSIVGAGECTFNIATISRELQICMETVRRNIRKLVSKGYILVQYRKNEHNNENSSNLFTICAMLTDKALELKKEYIKHFKTIKIGKHIVAVALNQIENMKKATNDKMESAKETAKKIVEKGLRRKRIIELQHLFADFGWKNIPSTEVLETIIDNFYDKIPQDLLKYPKMYSKVNYTNWTVIEDALLRTDLLGVYDTSKLFTILSEQLNTRIKNLEEFKEKILNK